VARSKSHAPFRDWWFQRAMLFLSNSAWKVVVTDFRKSKNKDERSYWGCVDLEDEVIYLDRRHAHAKILVHEIGHVLLDELLDDEARSRPKKDLAKIKNPDKFFRYGELRILEWEACFYNSLSGRQKKMLQSFIDNAPRGERR